jgi:hypothetical protein
LSPFFTAITMAFLIHTRKGGISFNSSRNTCTFDHDQPMPCKKSLFYCFHISIFVVSFLPHYFSHFIFIHVD